MYIYIYIHIDSHMYITYVHTYIHTYICMYGVNCLNAFVLQKVILPSSLPVLKCLSLSMFTVLLFWSVSTAWEKMSARTSLT